jgi:hypothetical protein
MLESCLKYKSVRTKFKRARRATARHRAETIFYAHAGRFPPIEVSGILKDGDMLVLTATRFENGSHPTDTQWRCNDDVPNVGA